jgi:uncharacterized repeat protein (TIGR01451 family)
MNILSGVETSKPETKAKWFRRRRRKPDRAPPDKEEFKRTQPDPQDFEENKLMKTNNKPTNQNQVSILQGGKTMTPETTNFGLGWRKTLTSVLALSVMLGATAPAYAAIDNTGSVTASTPDGGTVSDTSSESVTVAAPVREFTLVKSISTISVLSGDDAANPDGGDTITYQYAFANTGNITLDGTTVSITDPGPTFDGNAATNTLSSITEVQTLGVNNGDTDSDGNVDPGETWLYQATYLLDQADVDNSAGVTDGVSNTVTTVAANDTGGTPGTLDGGGSTLTATDTIPENGSVSLVKIATRDGSTEDDGSVTAYNAGDDIIYLFTVVNDGNVTLSSLTVSETAFVAPSGASAPTISCTLSGDATIASLAPGATETCTATYTVQEADL